MSEALALSPLMAFDEACRLVVDHLKREIPLAFWSVSRYQDDRQVYVCVQDDAYGRSVGDSHAWSDSFCRHMVAGSAPQIAPDAMAVPEYASAGIARRLPIGSYIGVPICSGDGTLFGTLCGFDPDVRSERITEHAPLLHLFSTLLGQILHAEHLRAEAVRREVELEWNAYHDHLTGLPNRVTFLRRLDGALQAHARGDRPLAVLLIDLDDFKAVNDTLGHAAGDELLVRAARRLQRAVRPGDTLARLSGDEFAVLLPDVTDPAIVAGRLLGLLEEPFAVDGSARLTVSASVGVTALGRDAAAAGVDSVLAQADVAMYTAKRCGKARFAVYDPQMTLPATTALRLREPLREAITDGGLTAVYQPVVDLGSDHPAGFEALARWRHEGRAVEPDVFVPVAARTGLMPALTDRMLDLAGAQLARWSARPGHDDLRVSVNVSPYCISDPSLPDRVGRCLRRHRIGPGRLVLEITEEALLHDLPTATAVAGRLRDLGVQISLDDFGVGYSSLLHLRRIPLHSVKVDRRFAGDIDTDPDTERFMRALLALGRDLGLIVVVEGVDRREQAEVLRRIGCTHAQGHWFGRPVPPESVRLDPA